MANRKQISLKHVPFGSGKTMWFGLSDGLVNGVYRWMNGMALTWENWSTGQPDSNNQVRCILVSSFFVSRKIHGNEFQLSVVCDEHGDQ